MTEEQEKALLKKIDAMEKVIDEFVKGYNDSEDQYNRSEFRKRNGDKLSKYSDEFKYWEGDDFDLADKAYDEFHSDDFKDWTEEDYINKLINVLEDQLKKNKEHYADKEEAVEEPGDTPGDTPVEAEVTVVSAEPDEAKEEEETAESEAEDDDDDDEDDEISEFEEYLAAHPDEGKKYR